MRALVMPALLLCFNGRVVWSDDDPDSLALLEGEKINPCIGASVKYETSVTDYKAAGL